MRHRGGVGFAFIARTIDARGCGGAGLSSSHYSSLHSLSFQGSVWRHFKAHVTSWPGTPTERVVKRKMISKHVKLYVASPSEAQDGDYRHVLPRRIDRRVLGDNIAVPLVLPTSSEGVPE